MNWVGKWSQATMGWPQGGDEVMPLQAAASLPLGVTPEECAWVCFYCFCGPKSTGIGRLFKQTMASSLLRACREAEHISALPVFRSGSRVVLSSFTAKSRISQYWLPVDSKPTHITASISKILASEICCF